MKTVYLVLHNVRSVLNVGSIFRTADAAGVKKIYLCGYTPIPKKSGRRLGNDRIKKTSLGAERTVQWEYVPQTHRLLDYLRRDGIHTVALEQSSRSVDYRQYRAKFPVALVVGNEVRGLSPVLIKKCESAIEIPMHGWKESLNVSVAVGIALYKLIE